MDEDQVCAFLHTLIKGVQRNELYTNSFKSISVEDGHVNIFLPNIDFSCKSNIQKLIKIILLNENTTIKFHKCVFGDNFVDYFIKNNIIAIK